MNSQKCETFGLYNTTADKLDLEHYVFSVFVLVDFYYLEILISKFKHKLCKKHKFKCIAS